MTDLKVKRLPTFQLVFPKYIQTWGWKAAEHRPELWRELLGSTSRMRQQATIGSCLQPLSKKSIDMIAHFKIFDRVVNGKRDLSKNSWFNCTNFSTLQDLVKNFCQSPIPNFGRLEKPCVRVSLSFWRDFGSYIHRVNRRFVWRLKSQWRQGLVPTCGK